MLIVSWHIWSEKSDKNKILPHLEQNSEQNSDEKSSYCTNEKYHLRFSFNRKTQSGLSKSSWQSWVSAFNFLTFLVRKPPQINTKFFHLLSRILTRKAVYVPMRKIIWDFLWIGKRTAGYRSPPDKVEHLIHTCDQNSDKKSSWI